MSLSSNLLRIRLLARAMLLGKPLQLVLAILGIAIGVCAVTLINSLSTGFSSAFLGKILDNMGHVNVTGRGGVIPSASTLIQAVEKLPGVGGAELRVETQALLEHRGILAGVRLLGVREGAWKSVLTANQLISGSRQGGLFIGRVLARSLEAEPGDMIRISLLDGSSFMRVCGVFSTGMEEYDSTLGYVSLEELQRLMDLPAESLSIMIRCKDPSQAPQVARAVSELGRGLLEAHSWQDENASLVMAFSVERRMMAIIGFLAVLVASFGSCSLLSVIAGERRREIAYAMALGLGRRAVGSAFLGAGLLIGTVGALIGSMLGMILSFALERWPISIPGDVYYISTLPVRLNLWDMSVTCLAAIFLALAASFFPAMKAAATDPVKTLRGEP